MRKHDFEIPDGLSPTGRKAARAIVQLAGPNATGGGCRAFYTPDEWRDRGEDYGLSAELIVCHDGGDLAAYFNLDYGAEALFEAQMVALQRVGAWAESCTCWYTAIYKG